jgi:hypothetical protein
METTKIATLRAAWASGEKRRALGIAARFPRLDRDADVIRLGWDACQRPDFYRQIRKDPITLEADALAALAALYSLES